MKIRMFSLLSSFTLLTAAAMAQDYSRMQANIPFEFHAAGKVLPAGVYTVRYDSELRVIAIKGQNGGVFTFAAPRESPKAAATSTLLFNRYDQTYFLSEIHNEGAVVGWQLPKAKDERRLAHNDLPAEPVTVALSRP